DQPAARSAAAPISATFYEMGGLYDGWVLESGEFTGVGGSMNATSVTIAMGDDAANRQYRSIISFDTTLLPPTAAIQSAKIYLSDHGFAGINPFVWGDLYADVKSGFFGTSKYVQLADFQAAASFAGVGTLGACASSRSHWCIIPLSSRAFPFINRSGLTQFRLRFAPDDNNNKKPDYHMFYSGLSKLVGPLLVVKYYP
ncbi:MAG: hypothetical protein WA821_16185, partial [Anaerolineales bacterium]